MLKTVTTHALYLLGLGLSLHGALTVFGPDWFRWWKEVVLLGLVALLLVALWPARKAWWGKLLNLTRTDLRKHPVTYALLFLAWLELLVWINSDWVTGLIAARYISLGFIVFLLLWGLNMAFGGKNGENFFHKFSTGLVTGSVISVLFGLWAQFLGGFELLSTWYSNTISSWVPGQTLPLYHQTSEGVVRMQGMASGPIEFSHLLVLCVWLVLTGIRSWGLLFRGLILCLLLLGVWFSGSRAALLAVLILLIFYAGKALILNTKTLIPIFNKSLAVNLVLCLLLTIASLGGLKYVVSELPDSYFDSVVRLSDSDHITRPIEAFKMGMAHPIVGNLGKLGPAARAQNMKLHNTDQAPIAENVFIDYFAQLGLVGLLLVCAFWVSWFFLQRRSYEWLLLGGILVLLMNFATILDMTPISIAWFATCAFGTMLSGNGINSRR